MEHKPIYLDGVDVSGCRHFLKDTEGQDYDTDEFVKGCCEAKGSCIGYEFAGYGLCRGDKDCYFKQLARKTRECEELKAYAQRQENQREEYYKEFLKKDKALEEIEGIAKNFGSYAAWQEQRINKILDIINKAKGEKKCQ